MKNDNWYFSYLLRIWQVQSENNPTWRVSLENPHTHEIKNFEDILSLYLFLKEIIAAPLESHPH